MKILLLGGGGMAGHIIEDYLKRETLNDVIVTTRKKNQDGRLFFDAKNLNQIQELISKIKPDRVINCIGLLNHSASENIRDAILINSLLPHELSRLLDEYGGKLIHISTDCVYSGLKGNYAETDEPDGTSVYARTKILGEIANTHHLTIRTSIIGPEIKEGIGLFQWFTKQEGDIMGYKNVSWNGVTTLELAKFIAEAIEDDFQGLYHLTALESLSKYELLTLIQSVFEKKDVKIHPAEQPISDRTLLNTRDDISYHVPTYLVMLHELKKWMDAS